MKRPRFFILLQTLPLTLLLTTTSCVREEEAFRHNTFQGNFEALWTIIDRQYCFLDYKQVNWDSLHAVYLPQAQHAPSSAALFEVLCNMLAELRDGHVNLSYAADFGHYWRWKEDYADNFDTELQERYLGHDYRIASGLYYKLLDDNIAYVVCNSFSNGFGEGNLDYVIGRMLTANGMIVDVRDNPGGSLEYARMLSQRFCHKRTLVGYSQYKTGPGHSDFCAPQAEYIEPGSDLRWTKPTVVLTNRSCYSATNTFVRNMKACTGVIILGDTTGGGSGLPFQSELPNGWSVRFSACPMLDADGNHIEFGIAPHIVCTLDTTLANQGIDSMIEAARELLR